MGKDEREDPLTLEWRHAANPAPEEKSEFRVDDVLSAFVHEARNALFGISATLEAFEADFSESELGAEYASMMRQPLQKLSTMMEELADYARPMGLELRRTDATKIATDVITSATGLAKTHSVTLRLVVAHAEAAPVRVDAERLGMALRSVLESAISRSRPGDDVELHVDEVDEPVRENADGRDSLARPSRPPSGTTPMLRFSVRDRGPALDASPGARFEPAFSQKARGGTVFNLARAQRIALQHGGTIVAHNHPECGVVVAILVPFAPNRTDSGAPCRDDSESSTDDSTTDDSRME